MREFNLLEAYPSSGTPRYVGDNIRTIEHRIVASYREKIFFDGDRNFGYGGFKYDGRWKIIAKKICSEYKLNENSKFLQIGCEKGFLLHDIKELYPKMKLYGLETSSYAVNHSMKSINKSVKKCDNYIKLEFSDNFFDFVLALGVVYTHNLTDAMQCIKEIQRVGKNNSFMTLASYKEKDDYWLFKQWTVLGTTILKEDEWKKVLKHLNYNGDYYFTNSERLNLQKNKS